MTEQIVTDNGAVIVALEKRIRELEKERFTFKKIMSNPAMSDYDKYVHIHDMLKEKGE